jgi:hypothetical protein
MFYRPVNISTKYKKGYQTTHIELLGQVLASTANQEGITYENTDDDVHNRYDGYIQKLTKVYELVPVS